ncbi:hypothetical protein AB3X93_42915, partial [Paraburkholderia sp. BR14262]
MAEQEGSGGVGAWSRAHRGKARRTDAEKSKNGANRSEKNDNQGRKRPGKKPLIVIGIVLLVIAI